MPEQSKGIQGICRYCGGEADGPRSQFCALHRASHERRIRRESAERTRRRQGAKKKNPNYIPKAKLREERVEKIRSARLKRTQDLRKIWIDLGVIVNQGRAPTKRQIMEISARLGKLKYEQIRFSAPTDDSNPRWLN